MKHLKLADFPARSFDKLRFGDTDRVGHVNNAVFVTICETGRFEVIAPMFTHLTRIGGFFMIARISVDYWREIVWPGTVEAGTMVTSIGQSSFAMAQNLFQNEQCVASAESVLVLVDRTSHRPMPLDETARAGLARFMPAA